MTRVVIQRGLGHGSSASRQAPNHSAQLQHSQQRSFAPSQQLPYELPRAQSPDLGSSPTNSSPTSEAMRQERHEHVSASSSSEAFLLRSSSVGGDFKEKETNAGGHLQRLQNPVGHLSESEGLQAGLGSGSNRDLGVLESHADSAVEPEVKECTLESQEVGFKEVTHRTDQCELKPVDESSSTSLDSSSITPLLDQLNLHNHHKHRTAVKAASAIIWSNSKVPSIAFPSHDSTAEDQKDHGEPSPRAQNSVLGASVSLPEPEFPASSSRINESLLENHRVQAWGLTECGGSEEVGSSACTSSAGDRRTTSWHASTSGSSGSLPPVNPKRKSPPSSSKNSPPDSKSASPRSRGELDGYNSGDEYGAYREGSMYDNDRESAFEAEILRVKNMRVHRMMEDGNCLFRAVADQVYGDPEMYHDTRHMCVDYMEKERDHFGEFVTESFSAYCKRKRRDKIYGNNLEIQAMAEMYNRPIHIFSYSTEPINIFQGSYQTDLPPIRLSYHRGNHYNSLVDPLQPAVGAGLGFGSLRGNLGSTELVKAAVKAQQEQQIEKALVAEGVLRSELELAEQQMERQAVEASISEYVHQQQQQQQQVPQPQLWRRQVSSSQETSSSANPRPASLHADSGQSTSKLLEGLKGSFQEGVAGSVSKPPGPSGGSEGVVTPNTRLLMSMGFSYFRVMEAYSIFGDELDNMLCFLIEMGSSEAHSMQEGGSRLKGKELLK